MWGWNVIHDKLQAIGLYMFPARHLKKWRQTLQIAFYLSGQRRSRIIQGHLVGTYLLHRIEAI